MNAQSDDARFFATLSGKLLSDREETPTFDHVVQSAVDVVGPCEMAGISLLRRGRLESVAATDPLVAECDALQHALGEGPCVAAALDHDFYVANDLAADERWPRWAQAATERGVRSIVSIRLSTDDEVLGALNLYSRHVHTWTQDDLDVALIYTAHATTAMVQARLISGLTTALNRRHTVGIAEGVLMSRHDLDLHEAFEALTSLARDHDLPLHRVAAMVVEELGLPERFHGVLD